MNRRCFYETLGIRCRNDGTVMLFDPESGRIKKVCTGHVYIATAKGWQIAARNAVAS